MKRIFLEQFTLHVETSALYSRPPSEYFHPSFLLVLCNQHPVTVLGQFGLWCPKTKTKTTKKTIPKQVVDFAGLQWNPCCLLYECSCSTAAHQFDQIENLPQPEWTKKCPGCSFGAIYVGFIQMKDTFVCGRLCICSVKRPSWINFLRACSLDIHQINHLAQQMWAAVQCAMCLWLLSSTWEDYRNFGMCLCH